MNIKERPKPLPMKFSEFLMTIFAAVTLVYVVFAWAVTHDGVCINYTTGKARCVVIVERSR